jgi:hypothetical protein
MTTSLSRGAEAGDERGGARWSVVERGGRRFRAHGERSQIRADQYRPYPRAVGCRVACDRRKERDDE